MTSDSLRSWMNMIRKGATMAMEAWDDTFKPNQDWNHPWGAAPANMIPRGLFGIRPLKPGFAEFEFAGFDQHCNCCHFSHFINSSK